MDEDEIIEYSQQITRFVRDNKLRHSFLSWTESQGYNQLLTSEQMDAIDNL